MQNIRTEQILVDCFAFWLGGAKGDENGAAAVAGVMQYVRGGLQKHFKDATKPTSYYI